MAPYRSRVVSLQSDPSRPAVRHRLPLRSIPTDVPLVVPVVAPVVCLRSPIGGVRSEPAGAGASKALRTPRRLAEILRRTSQPWSSRAVATPFDISVRDSKPFAWRGAPVSVPE